MGKPVKSGRISKLTTSKRVYITRRKVVLAGAIIALAGIGAVIGYHQYSWGRHIEYTETTYADTRSDIETRFNNEVIAAKDVDRISSSAATATESLCVEPFLGGMRKQLMKSARQQREECEAAAERLSHVVQTADTLSGRIDIERKLAAIYRDTQQALAKTKDYKSRPQIWREAKEKVEATGVDEAYQGQKKAQLAAISAVIAHYDKLADADKVKKRPEFDRAIKKLQEAYDALAESMDVAKMSYQSLVLDLAEAIEAL